jgi:hypothetical protein
MNIDSNIGWPLPANYRRSETMSALLKRLRELSDDQLLALTEQIDIEFDRRLERTKEAPESARRRAVERERSYRHCNGSAAVPVLARGADIAGRHWGAA